MLLRSNTITSPSRCGWSGDRGGYSLKFLGAVLAVAGQQTHLTLLLIGDDPVAVIFFLIAPARPVKWLTAGMTLVDTADSILMLGAYGWALRDPARKLRYN